MALRQVGKLAAAAALLAISACAYIDPGCFLPGQGSNLLRHGVLLRLAFRLPGGGFESFDVSRDGGVTYVSYQATLCQRMDAEHVRAVLQAWARPGMANFAEGECGPGWFFGRLSGYEEPCPGARRWMIDHRGNFGHYMMVDIHIADGPFTLFWDFEGPLPDELEAPLASTLGMACADSRALRRSVRRRAPELAAMAGC